VLKRKYPEQKAKVRIEQEDLKVTMIIEPEEGNREVIEHALDEYGLVIKGLMSLDDYTNDEIFKMELKNELRMARVRIESQTELLQYQNNRIKEKDARVDQLLAIIGQAIQKEVVPPSIIINVDSKSESHLSQNIKFVIEATSMIQKCFNELKKELGSQAEETEYIKYIQDGIDSLGKSDSSDEVKTSSVMSKFRKFLEDLGDDKSKMSKIIKGLNNGVRIAKDLAKHYNEIAQWCGLPPVPPVFPG